MLIFGKVLLGSLGFNIAQIQGNADEHAELGP